MRLLLLVAPLASVILMAGCNGGRAEKKKAADEFARFVDLHFRACLRVAPFRRHRGRVPRIRLQDGRLLGVRLEEHAKELMRWQRELLKDQGLKDRSDVIHFFFRGAFVKEALEIDFVRGFVECVLK